MAFSANCRGGYNLNEPRESEEAMTELTRTATKRKGPGGASARCRGAVATMVRNVRFLYFVLKHPGTPWYARVVLCFPVAYLFSPVQLLPNFIPVLGQMDDLFVIWVSNKFVRRAVNEMVIQDCQSRAAKACFLTALYRGPSDSKEIS